MGWGGVIDSEDDARRTEYGENAEGAHLDSALVPKMERKKAAVATKGALDATIYRSPNFGNTSSPNISKYLRLSPRA